MRLRRRQWWGLVFVPPVVAFFAVSSVFPVLLGFGISELRKAAHIDGATPWRTFWRIDLPSLRGTAVLVAALS